MKKPGVFLSAALSILLLSCTNPMVNYLLGDIVKKEEWIDPSPVAFYNGQWYFSLMEAIDQALLDNGGTLAAPLEIELRRNIADVHAMGAGELVIPAGLHIRLKPYTQDTPSVVIRRWQGGGAFITVEAGGSLTAGPSVTIDGAGISASDYLVKIQAGTNTLPPGSFTLDESDLRNGGPGGGIYVEAAAIPLDPAGLFVIRGGASRVSNANVYLETGAVITLDGSMSSNPVVLITPETYDDTVQVLEGYSGIAAYISNNNKQFDVTPEDPYQDWPGPRYWRVDSGGMLITAAASRESGGQTLWYSSLQEAFSATTGQSNNPDVVTLRENISMDADDTIDIATGKHIRLTVPAGASYSIKRETGPAVENVFKVNISSSLELGAPAGTELVIDGGALWKDDISPAEGGINDGIQSYMALVFVDGVPAVSSIRGIFKMTPGAVLQNNDRTADSYGKGGAVQALGLFEMSGGSIRRNRTAESGGGVYCGENPAMKTISGGVIEDNDALYTGGGVMMSTSGYARLTMTGGVIRNNRASGQVWPVLYASSAIQGFGGGIFIPGNTYNKNEFYMRGGAITDNRSAGTAGSGIVMDMIASTAPIFSLGASAVITGNDVHLHYNDYYQFCFITIESSLNAANPGEIVITMDANAAGSNIKVLGETASGLVSANYAKFTAPPYTIGSNGRLN